MRSPDARTGRGAPENRTPDRFNLPIREADGDWLDAAESHDGETSLRTSVTVEHARTIITRNASPDIGFDRSINPYRGCEHGCIYCFARPTHAFHDLSPGQRCRFPCSSTTYCSLPHPRRPVADRLLGPARPSVTAPADLIAPDTPETAVRNCPTTS